jgi:hypothetical protein
MLAIDSSPDAPAVEYLLDEAHQVCMNLIADIFQRVLYRSDHRSITPEVYRMLQQAEKIRGPVGAPEKLVGE